MRVNAGWQGGIRWMSILIIVLAVFRVRVALAQVAPDEMRVHFIDVGQGAATMFEFPCGAILVDAGGEKNTEYDYDSTEALKGYLTSFFARRADLNSRLDSLILTHPHSDHTRGVKEVLRLYRPRNIVTNGRIDGSGKAGQLAAHKYAADSEATTEPIGFRALSVTSISASGLTDAVIDPIRCSATVDPVIRALWGRSTTAVGWKPNAFKNGNNHSVVIRVDFGGASFLITGDLEEDAISKFLAKYKNTNVLNVDVYEVGHHGSGNGTTRSYLTAMSPKIAVIEMGPSDRETMWTAWKYGHPRKSVVDILVAAVSESRPPVTVPVAMKAETFTSKTIAKAVYGTGWDGTVVLSARMGGVISLVGTEVILRTTGKTNINEATAAELAALPGIGAARATAIVTYRTATGPFASIDDLDKVSGIGPATIAGIRDVVRVKQ